MALTTTQEWKQAVMARFRNQGYLRFVLELVPPGIREGAQVSTTSSESFTSGSIVVDGTEEVTAKYTTLEPLRTPLSDDWTFFPESPKSSDFDEWWSILSPSGGVTMSFTFDKTYSIPGLSILWDLARGAHPTTIDVVGYNQGKAEVVRYSGVEIDSSESVLDTPMDEVQYVDIVINGWSNPEWRYRIVEVTFGVNIKYEPSKIISSDRTSKISVLSNELPSFSQSVDIANYSLEFDPLLQKGVARYLAQRQRVNIQWGFDIEPETTQWLDPCTMYLSQWDIPHDSQTVSLTTETRLSFLTENFYKGVYRTTTTTYKDLALYLLQNSGIITEYDEEQPWILPDTLAEYSTKAVLPVESVSTLLMYIAGATGHVLDTDTTTGYPRFRKLSTEYDHQIGQEQTLGDPSVSIETPLKSIKVGIYKYAPDETETEICNDTFFLKGTQVVELTFTDNYIDLVIEVSGATLQSHSDYTSSVFLTIQATEGGQNVTILVKGKKLVQTVTYLETFNDITVQSGLNIVVENPLITESGQIQELSDLLKSYYSVRQTYTAPYTGYPEIEAGDMVQLALSYSNINAIIEQEDLSFNGGWDGTVVVH